MEQNNEAQSWTLCVHAKANKFNFRLKARRRVFLRFDHFSFLLHIDPLLIKLKAKSRVSVLKKSKSLKSKCFRVLEKCRIKNKDNVGAKRSSKYGLILDCMGLNKYNDNVAWFYGWIAAGKNMILTLGLNTFYQMITMFSVSKLLINCGSLIMTLSVVVIIVSCLNILPLNWNPSILFGELVRNYIM